MARRIDPRLHNNFIDTNFWDLSDNLLDDSAVTEILHLESEGEIGLILPFSVKMEIAHPTTPSHVKRSASCMIYTEPTELTSNERAIHDSILRIIQGNANPGKHDRDVMHLFEAHKYGGGYFITKDKRLLDKREEVERLLPSLRIVSPRDFIQFFHADASTKRSSHGWS
jgi:predicted nucleic acid-binding protein